MDNNEIGKRLKKIRIDRGLSQDELGRNLNLSRTAIGNWERGERSINLQDLNNLAAYFGIPVQYFLGEDEQEKLPKPEVNHVIRVVHIDPFPSILDYILLGVLVASLFLFLFLGKDDRIQSGAYFLLIGNVIGIVFVFKHIFNLIKKSKSVSFPSTQRPYFQAKKLDDGMLNIWLHILFVLTIFVTIAMTYGLIVQEIHLETFVYLLYIVFMIINISMVYLLVNRAIRLDKLEFPYYPTNRYFDLWVYDIILVLSYVLFVYSITVMISYGDYQQNPMLFWLCLSLLFASLLMANILVIQQRRIFNSYKIFVK